MATLHQPAESDDVPSPRRTSRPRPLIVKIELVIVDGYSEFGRELHKRQSAAVLSTLRRLAEQQLPDERQPHERAA